MSGTTEKLSVRLIATRYPTVDHVVALADVTEFGADPAGKRDSTKAVRAALDAVAAQGGGTVWMPAGRYLLTESVSIPTLVTLRGEYQDPDAPTFNGDYGTVIIAKVKSEDLIDTGLFVIGSSAGVEGLTVYYPEQKIDDVKPYPFTFFGLTGMLKTVRNCTVINGYRGIGTVQEKGHEMMMVKNFKGTFLKFGMSLNYSSDVGTVDGMTLAAKYWANAAMGLARADAEAIRAWCRENAVGMEITDVEQQQYLNITISGFKYGVFFPCRPARMMGSGSFFRLDVTDCEIGVYAEEGLFGCLRNPERKMTTIDNRWGYCIANSRIEGDKYSVCNDSSEFGGMTGIIKLAGVRLKGRVHGTLTVDHISNDLSRYTVNTCRIVKTAGDTLLTVESGARESDIQKVLNKAGKTGGVVYLPAGLYEIKKGLTVPAGVELHGAAGSSQRVGNAGTVLSVKFRACAPEEVDALPAAVTLAGDASGVTGVTFVYEENARKISGFAQFDYYPYALRARAKNVWCVDCCIGGGTHGVDFRACDDHVVENLVTCCIEKAIHVGGNNGIVMNCLQNGTVLYRLGLSCIASEKDCFQNYFNPIGRPHTDYITVEEGEGEQIVNDFIYGGKTMLRTENARKVLAVCIGADNIGDKGVGVMHLLSGGSVTVINSLRYNGISVESKDCDLRFYNRTGIWQPDDPDIVGD